MIRAIPVPPEIPENYQEIIVMFSEYDSQRGKSATMLNFSEMFLESLRKMKMPQRVSVIKQICSSIELSLLQSSSNPGEVNLREI